MATTITTAINYTGKRAAGYIAGAIANGVMIQGGHISMLLAVKNDMNVPVMKLNNMIVPYAVNFTAAGEIEHSVKVLSPKRLSVMFEIDIPTLESQYESEQMAEGMSNSIVPMSYEDFLVKYLQRIIANDMDNYIWNSDTTGTGTLATIDGLLKQIATGTPVTVPGTTLTTSNIVEELAKVYLAKPSKILGDSANFRVFVSPKTSGLLRVALYGMTGRNVAEANTLPFDPESVIVTVPGFPDNTIVGTSKNNIFFAADAESDMSVVNIIDQRITTNDDKYTFRMNFKLDVKVAFDDEVVYYVD